MKTIRNTLTQPGRGTTRPWVTAALSVAVVALIGGSAAARASSRPVVIEFQKRFDPAATAANNGTPTWTGTTSDGGSVEVRLVDYRVNGKAEHLTVDFIVATGERSFVARVAGVFNLSTKRTTLNGTVTSGWLEGARVHEEGLRTHAETSRFVGTLTIMPESSRQ